MAMRPSLRQHLCSSWGEVGYSIIAYPFYNRTREDVIKNKLPSGGDDELGLPDKGFRWGYAPHHVF
jgi:hypothetical protein